MDFLAPNNVREEPLFQSFFHAWNHAPTTPPPLMQKKMRYF